MRPLARKLALAAASLVLTFVLFEIAGRVYDYQRRGAAPLVIVELWDRVEAAIRGRGRGGTALNRAAWEAGFEERGLPVPESGPREGYWGKRIDPKNRACGDLVYCDREQRQDGLFEIDGDGLQHVSVGPEPRARLLILGGSVAWGAYASRSDQTYFVKLAQALAARGKGVHVDVLASGGWTSDDELRALIDRGFAREPDLVLFLDGLNDLTLFEPDNRNRTDYDDVRLTERMGVAYLANLAAAGSLLAEREIPCLVVLQPFPGGKRHKTAWEQQILRRTYSTSLDAPYRALAEALARRATEGGCRFLDASDALSDEWATTFTDQWHFADAGHTRLAEQLADPVAAMLSARSAERAGEVPRGRR